jgi:hypothetical protein
MQIKAMTKGCVALYYACIFVAEQGIFKQGLEI